MDPEFKSFIKIFITGCLWGTIGLFVKLMEAQGSSSSYTSFLRLLFGSVLVALLALIVLLPVYSKMIRKIKTSIEVEDNGEMGTIDLSGEA